MADHIVYGSITAPVDAFARNKRVPHFSSLARQAHAAKFGMWLFLGTEVLLFGGLFVSYAYFRTVYGATFAEASRHLSVAIGTINTLILILSSFAVALSSYFVHHDRHRAALLVLLLAIACGLAFLGLKADEWITHFEEGAVPGAGYHFAEVPGRGAVIFYALYFLLTGLHAFHVTVGIGVLAWASWLVHRRAVSRAYDTPLELSTLYWHLVDIIWIFLYPLLYLIG